MTYESCTKKLVVSSHKLNATSSRSHAIFTVEIESFNDEDLKLFACKLILVDLAGSEKIYSTIKDAKTKEESININRSLFSLRKVITSLSEGKSSSHVPFRDSKLTCLLKQSLGGDGSCLMVVLADQIGCILPTAYFHEDNLATLNYAYKANNIVNSIKKNEDPGFDLISKLKHQILSLQTELAQANQQIQILDDMVKESGPKVNGQSTSGSTGTADHSMFQKIYEKIEYIQSGSNWMPGVDSAGANQTKATGLRSSTASSATQQPPIDSEEASVWDEASAKQHKVEYGSFQNANSRFLETMTLFKDLLKSNQELRQELTVLHSDLHSSGLEKRGLLAENQDLREKLNNLRLKLDSVTTAEHIRSSVISRPNTQTFNSMDLSSTVRSKNSNNWSSNHPLNAVQIDRLGTPQFDKAQPFASQHADHLRHPLRRVATVDNRHPEREMPSFKKPGIEAMSQTFGHMRPNSTQSRPYATTAKDIVNLDAFPADSTGRFAPAPRKPPTRFKVGAPAKHKSKDLDFITFI